MVFCSGPAGNDGNLELQHSPSSSSVSAPSELSAQQVHFNPRHSSTLSVRVCVLFLDIIVFPSINLFCKNRYLILSAKVYSAAVHAWTERFTMWSELIMLLAGGLMEHVKL